MSGYDKSVSELTRMIIDAIKDQLFFNEETLTPKINSFIRAFIKKQDRPDYNQVSTPTKLARQFKQAERKEAESDLWREIVKGLVDEQTMHRYYKEVSDKISNQFD